MVGLNNSIGKTFYSDKFVEMNSRTFILTCKEDIMSLKTMIFYQEVPFVNFGLMKGLVRSDGGGYGEREIDRHLQKTNFTELAEAVSRMGWCHKELVKGFEFLHEDLTYLFKHYHNKFLLSAHLLGIPYYIPTWLGGLGLSPGFEPQSVISDRQRQCAQFIYQNYAKLKPANVTLSKTCLLDSIVEREFDKLQKQYNVPDIPSFQYIELEEGLDSSYLEHDNQIVYGHVIERSWRNLDLSEFFHEIDDDFVSAGESLARRKLLHNLNIWRQAYVYVTFKKPETPMLPWCQIWAQKRPSVRPIVFADPSRINSMRCALAKHSSL